MVKFLLYIVGGVLLLILIGVAIFGAWFAIQIRLRRKREPGFEYVYVQDDGGARELTTGEMKYLNTKFSGGDSGRPYIKLKYESLTPNGLLRGYLRRRQLPKDVPIRPAPSGDDAT